MSPEPVDLSAARAARLAALPVETQVESGVGGWRWRVVGRDIQLRNRRLPHLRLDLTASEAQDLAHSLAWALGESLAMPVVRVSLWRRAFDWLARRTWARRHAVEQAEALKQLAKDFSEGGGW